MSPIKFIPETDHPLYVTEVGRLCAAWSYLEMITDRLLWGILNVDEKIGSLISSQKELAGRWSLIINHGENRVTDSELKTLRKINKALVDVAVDRNIVVHGQIFVKSPEKQGNEKEVYAVITRGACAGNYYPMSKEAVEIIIKNIAAMAEPAINIARDHNWLTQVRVGPHITDWPKPLAGFQ